MMEVQNEKEGLNAVQKTTKEILEKSAALSKKNQIIQQKLRDLKEKSDELRKSQKD